MSTLFQSAFHSKHTCQSGWINAQVKSRSKPNFWPTYGYVIQCQKQACYGSCSSYGHKAWVSPTKWWERRLHIKMSPIDLWAMKSIKLLWDKATGLDFQPGYDLGDVTLYPGCRPTSKTIRWEPVSSRNLRKGDVKKTIPKDNQPGEICLEGWDTTALPDSSEENKDNMSPRWWHVFVTKSHRVRSCAFSQNRCSQNYARLGVQYEFISSVFRCRVWVLDYLRSLAVWALLLC